jgi:hypothetical protein
MREYNWAARKYSPLTQSSRSPFLESVATFLEVKP